MQWIEQEDGSKVSTPIWAGYGQIPQACPEGEHDWKLQTQSLGSEVAASIERCVKCGWQRYREIPWRSSE